MLYNKNQTRKVNDKKVLHKVGKNWKVVSLALLMAIGGGAAVATTNNANANADTTNDNAPRTNLTMQSQGSNSVSSNVQSEVNSLEAAPKFASAAPSSASSSNVSTNSTSASSAASVSYLSGDNGSAASYHAESIQKGSVFAGYKSAVESYVNSINAQFPEQANSLTADYNSANAKHNNDQNLATQFSNTAKQSGTTSVVNSLASKAGLTASDYVSSVENSTVSFSNAIQSGSALINQMSAVNSDAQLIGNINSDYALSTEYYIKKVAADDNATVALNILNNAKSIQQNLIDQNSADLSDAENYNNAKLADQIALINSGVDADYANSLAKSLGYANSNAISSTISSAANSFKANGEDTVNFTNASSSAVALSESNANLYRILSDTNAMQKFGSLKAYNMSPASSAMESADSEVAKDQANYESASSAASVADILGNHPTLANLFGTTITSKVVKHLGSAEARSAEQSLSNVIANDNKSAEQSAVSEAKQELLTNSDNDTIDGLNQSVQNEAAKVATTNLTNLYNKAHATWISAWNAEVTNAINAKFNDSKNKKFYHNAARKNHALKNLAKNVAASTQGFVKKYGKIGALAQMPGKQKNNDYAAYVNANNNISSATASAFKSLVNSANYKSAYNNAVNAKAPSTSEYNSDVTSLANSIMSATASDRAYNEASATSALNAVKASASGYTTTINLESGGLLSGSNYALASDAIKGDTNASQVASTASSASQSLANTEKQSASYASNNDTDATLAGYYAQSYANENLADTEALAKAQSNLDSFYNDHTNNNYGTALNNAKNAEQDMTDSTKLAEAFGIHVYNYSPKYITVTKNGLLHQDTNYDSQNDKVLANVHAGEQLQVLGVGFSVNGTLRYLVNVNGNEGFFTANQDYVKSTYLPATDNADVTFTKPARIYNKANFAKDTFTGHALKAGTVLKNVKIVREDSNYKGFTRIETPSGAYITANSDFVQLNEAAAPKAATKSVQNTNPVQFK